MEFDPQSLTGSGLGRLVLVASLCHRWVALWDASVIPTRQMCGGSMGTHAAHPVLVSVVNRGVGLGPILNLNLERPRPPTS